MTDMDTTLMNVIATVLPESSYFHVGKNVRVMCITDCRYALGKKDLKELDAIQRRHFVLWVGGYVSRYALGNIVLEEQRCKETLCMDNVASYGLPCAFFIAVKIRDNKPILLDEIHRHWHRLCMAEENNEDGFSVDEEWNSVQERLKKVPYQMKLEIKEVLR
ncbi:hypothetical protein MTR_1g072330 [Medicago truncatula]|uniref:Uncharacterized protein n=1 Tax=Medicago truncatula TaxID=3880 RepID=G7IED9_MEDTR|nr:hypothetical protein MTR_1g072330 [Medicago truncatula]